MQGHFRTSYSACGLRSVKAASRSSTRGCTNSVARSNGAICSGIVFVHPTGYKRIVGELGETNDQFAKRRLEWRPPGRAVRIRPAASDQLAAPAQAASRASPGSPPRRSAARCQQRPISPRGPRLPSLPTKHREFMAQHQDLELRRATRPSQQPDEREQVPHGEIHERPDQAALLTNDNKSAEPSQLAAGQRPWTSLRTLRPSRTRRR